MGGDESSGPQPPQPSAGTGTGPTPRVPAKRGKVKLELRAAGPAPRVPAKQGKVKLDYSAPPAEVALDKVAAASVPRLNVPQSTSASDPSPQPGSTAGPKDTVSEVDLDNAAALVAITPRTEPEPEPEPGPESESQPERADGPDAVLLPDLSAWLQACGCDQLAAPLHELGAEHPTDLLHLEQHELKEVLSGLKKLPLRKFNRQLTKLREGDFASSHLELLPPSPKQSKRSPKKNRASSRQRQDGSPLKEEGENVVDIHGIGNDEVVFTARGTRSAFDMGHMSTAMQMMEAKAKEWHESQGGGLARTESEVHFAEDEKPVYLVMADFAYCPPGKRSDGRPRKMPSKQIDPEGVHADDLSFAPVRRTGSPIALLSLPPSLSDPLPLSLSCSLAYC